MRTRSGAAALGAAGLLLLLGLVTGRSVLLVLAMVSAGLSLVAGRLGADRPEAAPEMVWQAEERDGADGLDLRWVSEILPRLDGLGEEDLALLEARERRGRARASVLTALVERRAALVAGGPPLVAAGTSAEEVASEVEALWGPPAATGPVAPSVDISAVPDTAGAAGQPDLDPDTGVLVPTFLGRPAAPVEVQEVRATP